MNRYFIYSAEEVFWYETERDWKKAVAEYDWLGRHCDDGWDNDVDHVMAGIVPEGFKLSPEDDTHDRLKEYATHTAEQIDLMARPPENEIDEDGLDKEGRYWGADWGWHCHYTFVEVE